ncbi:MAG: type II toxin-antitoxin system RelE/ParE family toxin [Thaumarchaeota archaeon]|nr:type II toxin-antitoxin system RelE/ParE family toxin [Nitrososphaerota archaeon]
MTYSFVSTANFERGLKRLSSNDLQRARQTLVELARDPYSFKELRGRFRDLRSARFGDHRIIYAINENSKEIVLLAVEPRGSAYDR